MQMKLKLKGNKPAEKVTKPYLTGSVTDENTLRNILKLFGTMILVFLMTFIVCLMTSVVDGFIRGAFCMLVEALVLFILYNAGAAKGAEAVARGEILYQRKEKGVEFTPAEQRLSFHPAKGYFTAFCALIPFILCAVVLALTARKQMTGIGALPSWTEAFLRRSEIGDALATYTNVVPVTLTDILRMIVRIAVMPFVSMVGTSGSDRMLLLERLSPVLLLLPAAAYGTGYLAGRGVRTRIHSEIAENRKIRAKKERKARKARTDQGRKREPEQLN